jgi:hypothetical protein
MTQDLAAWKLANDHETCGNAGRLIITTADCGEAVLDNWESGGLAAAVKDLEAAIKTAQRQL